MSGDCKCRPISVKRNLKTEAYVVVSIIYCSLPCSRLVKITRDNLKKNLFRGVLTKNTPLYIVTAFMILVV